MTNRCIRICFTASDKFNLITRDTHLSSFLRLLRERRILLPVTRQSEAARIRSYEESIIQECKDSRTGMSGFKYSRIRSIPERLLSRARLRIAAFYLLAFAPEVTWRRYLSRFIATLLLFLRNKHVSRGKQEAISAGLADRAISAIPLDSHSRNDLTESILKSDPTEITYLPTSLDLFGRRDEPHVRVNVNERPRILQSINASVARSLNALDTSNFKISESARGVQEFFIRGSKFFFGSLCFWFFKIRELFKHDILDVLLFFNNSAFHISRKTRVHHSLF